MASVRFYACLVLVLILLSISWSEARPLNSDERDGRNLTKLIRLLGEGAKEVLKIRSGDHATTEKSLVESKRISPGGPDPKHHSIQQ
ncbi:hypothetical protein ACOSP7_011883 [Xanthoceras sorbifolium]